MPPAEEDQLLRKVVDTIRASSALAAQDVDFHRSLSRPIGKSLDETSTRMVSLINSLLSSIDQNSEPLVEGKETLNEYWKDFSNMMDNLFELSDRSADILTRAPGSRKDGEKLKFLDNSSSNDSIPSKRISKPQLNFKNPVNNTEIQPFVPLLKEKPFALRPLISDIVPGDDVVPEHYAQPYEYEIEHQEYGESVIVKSEPIPSKPWETTEALWVDNIEVLKTMISDLKSVTEIAVDLEHHDYRSYYGIVCLMQISTRERDYLIDTIALRDDLQILNEVFANPKILKVFHGAFMDIIWLQRDLGLYVVSLFDTFHASRAIGLPRHSLAYLLEKFANFKTSKKYQLADWRLRPLSKAMNAYARADTHFLLNIYDQLRNTLIEQNKLAGVLAESRNVAKRRFEYSKFRPIAPSPTVYCPIDKPDPWKVLMFQYSISPNREELVKKLYDWRDTIARRDDESPRYVMPNQLLVELARQAPTEPINVISVNSIVTDHVRSNSLVLAHLIKNTLASSDKESDKGTFEADNNSTDAASLLTVPQIQKLAACFAGVSRAFTILQNEYKDGRSSSIFTDILTSEDDAVNYVGNNMDHITKKELGKRAAKALQSMEQFDEATSYYMPIPEIAKESNTMEEIRPPAPEEVKESPSPPKEDMDEIITLKKIKKQKSQSPKELGISEREIPAVDYTKTKKVLATNQDKNKDKKKRKFDPYAASNHSSDAPRAPKKRKSVNRGRNVSFKR